VLSGKASGRSRWAFVLAMRGFQITDLRFEFLPFEICNLRRKESLSSKLSCIKGETGLINIPENVSLYPRMPMRMKAFVCAAAFA
jgi:hypothetical protein